ncbi:MAG: hypothetical protein ACE5DX_01520 [Candidatus Dojkabacteria bacterium]
MGIFSQSEITTQAHLEIEDIRDDLVILKNGNVSMVMETSALNFELLSEREQDAKIVAFAALMNSLQFQMQIVIKTERSDLSAYIEKLQAYREQQISNALKRQIDIYISFIRNLTFNTEVLDKRFFVVIPEVVAAVQRTSTIKQIFGQKPKITNIKSILQKTKVKIYPKRDHLIKQFKRMNISARQLTNDELIRLYYSMYDPDRPGLSKLELSPTQFTSSIVEPLTDKLQDDNLSNVKQQI